MNHRRTNRRTGTLAATAVSVTSLLALSACGGNAEGSSGGGGGSTTIDLVGF